VHAIARNYTRWQTEIIEPDVFRASEIETANRIDCWDARIGTAAAKGEATRSNEAWVNVFLSDQEPGA